MFSLSRILLRYCQSAIVALALCLVPEVEASLAQSVRNIASDLDIWVAQELILPGDATELDLIEEQPSPESIYSSEFSVLEAETTDLNPSLSISPDLFLNQPTISSELLLPPGEEGGQLLLAPAVETSQLLLPAAAETQLLLPAAQETGHSGSLSSAVPVTSQRFLPAATVPVGLLAPAQDSPTINPLTIAIDGETDRQISLEPSARQESVPEQVGRVLARTTTQTPSQQFSSTGDRINDVPVTPRSNPALLPASTVPRTPLPRSAQAADFTPRQTNSSVSLSTSRETIGTDTGVKPSPKEVAGNASETIPSLQPSSSKLHIDSNLNNEDVTASREIAVAVQPRTSPWFSLQNQVLAGLGVFVLFLFALSRWIMSGGQTSFVEETDWDSLPRSKSRDMDKDIPSMPVYSRRKRDLSQALQSFQPSPITRVSSVKLANAVIVSDPSGASVPERQIAPRSHAAGAVPDLQLRRSRPVLPLDNEGQLPFAEQKQQKTWSGTTQRSDLGVWITIALIGFLGLAAWLIEFYGVI